MIGVHYILCRPSQTAAAQADGFPESRDINLPESERRWRNQTSTLTHDMILEETSCVNVWGRVQERSFSFQNVSSKDPHTQEAVASRSLHHTARRL